MGGGKPPHPWQHTVRRVLKGGSLSQKSKGFVPHIERPSPWGLHWRDEHTKMFGFGNQWCLCSGDLGGVVGLWKFEVFLLKGSHIDSLWDTGSKAAI